MKFLYTLLAIVGLTVALDFGDWHPPVPSDLRSPCPALNSLANHGFIPRNGRDISVPVAVKALQEAVNVSTEVATTIAMGAMRTSTSPSSGTFTLGDLKRHNIIEHDGSLSRKDVAEGDVGDFCPGIFSQYLSAFNGAKDVSLPLAAAARWNQIKRAKKADPKFNLTPSGQFNSYLESSILFELFKNATTGLASVDLIKIFFEEERLPAKEGWRPNNILGAFSLAGNALQLALNTPEDKSATPPEHGTVGFHGMSM